MIGIYIRESTKRQYEQGFNADTQRNKIFQYLELYDMGKKDKRLYEEKGYSAKTVSRPVLNEMISDIRDGKIDTVVVYKLDRLLRRHTGKETLFSLFSEHNVTLISVLEKLDTSTALGRFQLNTMVSASELEQDMISERTIDGLVTGAEQGYFMYGGKVAFGYKRIKDGQHYKLVVNEKEAEVKRKIYGYLKKGLSVYQIMLYINEDSYMKEIGKTFGETQIVNTMKSKMNIGIMEMGGKEYKMDCQIFTEKEYEDILYLFSMREHVLKYDYLFAKKVINKKGKFATMKSTVKKDRVYLYYYDNESRKRISEIKLQNAFIKHAKEKNILYRKKRGRTYVADTVYLKRKKDTLVKMYEEMNISTENYIEEMAKLEKELKYSQMYYDMYIKKLDEYFEGLEYEQKEKLVNKCIKYIEVDFEDNKNIAIYDL